MPRKARERSATGCYHIMARGINHTAIYNDDADNMNFLHILDFCADEDFTIFAYCLMGNHFHLLAKADADVLQHVMKAVGIRYVAYFNRRYQRMDLFFAGGITPNLLQQKDIFCVCCVISIATRLLPESCRKCRTTLGAVILITLAAEKRYFVR